METDVLDIRPISFSGATPWLTKVSKGGVEVRGGTQGSAAPLARELCAAVGAHAVGEEFLGLPALSAEWVFFHGCRSSQQVLLEFLQLPGVDVEQAHAAVQLLLHTGVDRLVGRAALQHQAQTPDLIGQPSHLGEVVHVSAIQLGQTSSV